MQDDDVEGVNKCYALPQRNSFLANNMEIQSKRHQIKMDNTFMSSAYGSTGSIRLDKMD